MSNENDIAVKVSHVSKSFKLPHEQQNSLKGKLINFHKRGYEMQHALQGISFGVRKGEFFGIVGRNGSGKSTLLKMLAGIYTPDSGSIEIDGKLTPFIELGVGFNPELSGRDNVFLNGALLGFNRKEMLAMYDDIVKFAEIERFMDQKLKNYSSGMQVRLAFSIAIRANTDILVLDEVLAVGDANFQKKCFDYFNKLKKDKKTIILVTHDMSSVERFCDRALLIDKSHVLLEGSPTKVTKAYSDLNFQAAGVKMNKARVLKAGSLEVKATMKGQKSHANTISADEDQKIVISLDFKSSKALDDLKLGVIVNNKGNSPIFATNTKVLNQKISIEKDKNMHIEFIVDNVFSNGEYSLSLSLKSIDDTTIYFTEDNLATILVGGRKHDYALASPRFDVKIG